MELTDIALHIEALLFASDKPLPATEITALINTAIGFLEQTITLAQTEELLQHISAKYAAPAFAFTVRETGGGWQFLTKPLYHKTIVQLNGDRFLKRLSTAAMETLAIIAYKQPVTKGEIEGIRGVNSDYSIQKLLEKELVVISGRSEDLPGKPLLYVTSRTFMDYFGISNVSDLPKIKEVLAEQPIQPTIVNEHSGEKENQEPLGIDANGDLVPAFDNDTNDDLVKQ